MTQMPDPAAPTIEPEFVDPPSWPKVIGIISTVWGVLNIGCIGCGVVGMLMPSMMSGMMAEQFPDGMPPQVTQGPSIGMLALFAFGFLLCLLLITAGVTLLTRKYAARILHLIWAVAAVLSTFGSFYFQVTQQQEVRQWIRDHPNTKFAQQQAAFGSIGEVIGWTLGIALGLGYPAFCGVWFGLVKKKPEEYTRGIEQLM